MGVRYKFCVYIPSDLPTFAAVCALSVMCLEFGKPRRRAHVASRMQIAIGGRSGGERKKERKKLKPRRKSISHYGAHVLRMQFARVEVGPLARQSSALLLSLSLWQPDGLTFRDSTSELRSFSLSLFWTYSCKIYRASVLEFRALAITLRNA